MYLSLGNAWKVRILEIKFKNPSKRAGKDFNFHHEQGFSKNSYSVMMIFLHFPFLETFSLAFILFVILIYLNSNLNMNVQRIVCKHSKFDLVKLHKQNELLLWRDNLQFIHFELCNSWELMRMTTFRHFIMQIMLIIL